MRPSWDEHEEDNAEHAMCYPHGSKALEADGHDGHAPELNGLLADCPGCVTPPAEPGADQ